MALRAALRDALACEDRTRAAEQRAADAEARAAAAEARADEAEQQAAIAELLATDSERELRFLRMDNFGARRLLLTALPEVAHGRSEAAIRIMCRVADGFLSTEGDDGWRFNIAVQCRREPVQVMEVYTYWTVHTLKAVLAERYGISIPQQCLMHAGMQLEDNCPLSDFHPFDPAHLSQLPIFILSDYGSTAGPASGHSAV